MSVIQTQQIVKNRPREYFLVLKDIDKEYIRFANKAGKYVPLMYRIFRKTE